VPFITKSLQVGVWQAPDEQTRLAHCDPALHWTQLPLALQNDPPSCEQAVLSG
jgi:hypothetical protein